MKFCKLIILLSLLLCSFSGCSAKVTSLMEKGEYEDALLIVEKNPDKYSDVYDEIRYQVAKSSLENGDYERTISLLEENNHAGSSYIRDKALNLKSAIEIENYYNEMLEEMDEHNPDTWQANFDYLEASDFYLKINDMLNNVYDTIVKDNSLENAKDGFVEIFGYETNDISQAKSRIEVFKEESKLNMVDQMIYHQPYALNYVMDTLTKHNDYVRFEMTSSSGYMIIEKPFDFLKNKKISSKTFAYLLGVCEDYGALINRNDEKIEIQFKKWENARGYYYCTPNSQHDSIKDFEETISISIDRWGVDDIGVWMDIIITNPNKYDIKYLSIDTILKNANDKHLQTSYVFLENVKDNKIKFTLDFYDVTMDDLENKKYASVEFLIAIVFNN